MDRGVNWAEQKTKANKRDKNTCRKCGLIGLNLPVHHIIPYHLTKDNNLSNLVTLCKKCHMKMENEYRRIGVTNYVVKLVKENIMLEGDLNGLYCKSKSNLSNL